MAMAITNDDAIANLFQSTNLRIYKALLDIDAVIGADAVTRAANSTIITGNKADVSTTYYLFAQHCHMYYP